MYLIDGFVSGSDDGHTCEEVEQIPVADGPDAAHLCLVGHQFTNTEQMAVGIELFDGVVAEGDDLIEVQPGFLQHGVSWRPGVAVEVLPYLAVVPVVAACGNHGFVGAECL